MDRLVYVLHSTLSLGTLPDALRHSMAEERRTAFTFSNTPFRRGSQFLGEVSENTFSIEKRRFNENDYPVEFRWRFESESGGTRIEGYFEEPDWSKRFRKIWLGVVVVAAPLIFLKTLVDVMTGSSLTHNNLWLGLVVPPTLVLTGLLAPKIGRTQRKKDEQQILDHLRNTLGARIDEPNLSHFVIEVVELANSKLGDVWRPCERCKTISTFLVI